MFMFTPVNQSPNSEGAGVFVGSRRPIARRKKGKLTKYDTDEYIWPVENKFEKKPRTKYKDKIAYPIKKKFPEYRPIHPREAKKIMKRRKY